MIKVIGSTACLGSTVKVDPWIPLKITWDPHPDGQPLYLRVSGNRGGEIEFKVDRQTGRLIQVISIDSPPTVDNTAYAATQIRPAKFAPIIDRSPWKLTDDPEFTDQRASVAITTEPLGLANERGVTTLVIRNAESTSYIDCEGARIGVSREGYLTEISAAPENADTQFGAGGFAR
jgi:hypothetical protein